GTPDDVDRGHRGWCGWRGRSLHDGAQRLAKFASLIRRHLDDEPSTTLERDAHHDAPSLLSHLKGTVTGPGLHGRHSVLPPCISSPPVATRHGDPLHSPLSAPDPDTQP